LFHYAIVTLEKISITKSKDLQNVVLSKYIAGDYPRKIFRELHGQLGLYTVQRWCKIDDSGSINLSKPPGADQDNNTKGKTSTESEEENFSQGTEY
jgi:hypothetical protein